MPYFARRKRGAPRRYSRATGFRKAAPRLKTGKKLYLLSRSRHRGTRGVSSNYGGRAPFVVARNPNLGRSVVAGYGPAYGPPLKLEEPSYMDVVPIAAAAYAADVARDLYRVGGGTWYSGPPSFSDFPYAGAAHGLRTVVDSGAAAARNVVSDVVRPIREAVPDSAKVMARMASDAIQKTKAARAIARAVRRYGGRAEL